jgi:hypothetical protein
MCMGKCKENVVYRIQVGLSGMGDIRGGLVSRDCDGNLYTFFRQN